jgi:hypothetical protein
MLAISRLGKTTVDDIQVRFPRTPRHRIRGSGKFLLVFKCSAIWAVNAYETAEERDAAWERYQWNSCSYHRCAHDHAKVNL